MRSFTWLSIGVVCLTVCYGCRKEPQTAKAPSAPATSAPTPAVKVASAKIGEVGCAMCIYEMAEAKGCELAVDLDGKRYLVSGVEMDSLGDAHAADGLCSTARQAKIEGRIEGDRFVATKIELLPKGGSGG